MSDAGWYPNPHDPTTLRYYDGQQWTEHIHALPGAGGPTATAASGSTQTAPPETSAPEPIAHPGGRARDRRVLAGRGDPAPRGRADGAVLPGRAADGAVSRGRAADDAVPPVEQQTAQYPQVQPQPYRQPGYQQTEQYPAAGPPPTGYPQTYPPAAPYQTPPKKRSRALLIVAVVVVLAVAAGAAWYLLRPDKPKLTFAGKDIKDASQVLDSAETPMSALVKARHGASSDSTRCYFAVPEHPSGAAKKTDVDSHLRCGPVLFVDGDPNAQYLQYLLTSAPAGNSVALTVAPQPSSPNPSPIGDFDLKRPDGKGPPAGTGGLTVPAPPAAERDVFTTSDLGPVTTPAASAATALMVGRDTGVKLVSAGYVARYGSGDEARSAPAGERLRRLQNQRAGRRPRRAEHVGRARRWPSKASRRSRCHNRRAPATSR